MSELDDLLLRLSVYHRAKFFKLWNQSRSEMKDDESSTRTWTERLMACVREIHNAAWTLPEAPRFPSFIRFVSMASKDYPPDLFELPQPPLGLFVHGAWPLPQRISVIGSRKPTPYALRMTREVVKELVAMGQSIVSGGAIGIDTISHEAALDAGGKTVVVLGGGLLKLYPRQNENLFEEVIARGGALVSEYAPSFEAQKYSFPERNRIIAALSPALVLAQAHERSGSLSTARVALDLGREIFVLRPLQDDENFSGSRRLIELGAREFVRGTEVSAASRV